MSEEKVIRNRILFFLSFGLLITGSLYVYFTYAHIDLERPLDPKRSFSIVVLPDTQIYAEKYPEIFCSQTEWIAGSVERYNIKLVTQLGDIVNQGGDDIKQWDVAKNCFQKLVDVVPWSVVPGNHDTDRPSNKASGFLVYDQYFPKSMFEDYSWYKEGYRNNQNSYIEVDALGMEISLLNLSVEPDDDILAWAKRIIEGNSDRYFIIATHKYLPDNETGRDTTRVFGGGMPSNSGEEMWNRLIRGACPVKLVLSGHFHYTDGEYRLPANNDCGQEVQQITQDYQARDLGGAGKLRIYIFTPKDKKIEVKTYSPYTNTFETDFDSQFEFLIR